MFMVVSDVTGRYLFLTPVPGTTEIGENVLAFVIFLSWAAGVIHSTAADWYRQVT
jgi:TRAP-type C4-dicarboxylate transport system permease small subunit